MRIREADISEAERIRSMVDETIRKIYPRYYPAGAVDFFLQHHNLQNISEDIKSRRVFVCVDEAAGVVGTVTVKDNAINRLFVLPGRQRKGYGGKLLDFAEKMISERYSEVVIDASFAAKKLYLTKGYKDKSFEIITTDNGDYLCYDTMIRELDG